MLRGADWLTGPRLLSKMKTLWLWIIGIGALAAFLWYRAKTAAKTTAQSASTVNTGTATGANGWWPGLLGLTNQSLKTGNVNSQNAFSELEAISNAFGANDGGNSSGVSVGGSSAGGAQSSGSGAGLPTNSPGTTNITDTLGMSADGGSWSTDYSNPQSAANYDDPSDFNYF